MARLLVLLSLLGLAWPIQAATLVLSWDYDPATPVESFLVSYYVSTDPSGTPQQFRVPWTAEPTCTVLGPEATPETFCARPPGCLSPGLYRMSVQAERGELTSDPSPAAVCEALPNCTYNCQQFEDVNAVLRNPTAPMPTLVSPTAPDPAPLQALRDELERLNRQIPQPPATTVVAPAPT